MLRFFRRPTSAPVSRTQDILITGTIARSAGGGVRMLPRGAYRLVASEAADFALTGMDGIEVAQFSAVEVRQLMACRAMRPAPRGRTTTA